ncbi:6-carboxytetrahydropterin synthase [bacterium]|nr:6-carboxytetrahydropterin synthase [bacterium]
MKFTSSKVIDIGSAAFRQWRSTHSHCQYIHGYRLKATITFECDKLDDKNWVMDFGGLKDLKATLRNTFDHKLVVAGDDPEIETLKQLDSAGLAQVVILHSGVGCERFAQYVLKTADTYVDEVTDGRVRVYSVQINEHENNYATCYRSSSIDLQVSISDTEATTVAQLEDIHGSIAIDTPTESPASNNTAAPVGKTQGTKTKGGWFDGTTWG